MPVILAIETATSICSIALSTGDGSFHEISLKSNRRHNEILPGMVEQLLSDSGVKSREIDVVAVSIGPGSFSGLRVGLSWVKGFALGVGATVAPVETLDGIALRMIEHLADQSSEDKHSYSLCPLVPARKGESFGRIYQCSGEEIISCSETMLVNAQQLIEILPDDCYIAGEGADVITGGVMWGHMTPLHAQAPLVGFKYIPNLPASAIHIGKLALKNLIERTESILSPEELEPLYLKEFTVRER